MSFFKSIISSVLPPQPYEVAPQIAVAILNLYTNSSVFRKFSDIQTLRELSEKIPFYHAIREYLYEASCYCDRRIEQEITLEHF